MRKYLIPFAVGAVFAVVTLSACGGGGAQSPVRSIPTTTSTPPASVFLQPSDAWPMQSGNVLRNGFQNASIGLTSATANNLHLAWSDQLDTVVQASPVVGKGIVYIATLGGDVIALSAASGAPVWSTNLGSFVRGTPTLDGNTLVVPMYNPGGVAALNATTGAILWTTPATAWTDSDPVRTEPLVANGIVYAGTAGGDPPQCDPGTLAALSEMTGLPIWTWATATSGQGVGVWSPISLTPDGNVLFGTGNGCTPTGKFVEAVPALNAQNGAVNWVVPTSQTGPDADVGGGVAEAGVTAFFTGKDGNLYAIRLSDGSLSWQRNLGSVPGFGSIATPATDGSNVITQSGALTDPNQNQTSPGSVLYNYGVDGTLRWKTAPFQLEQFSSPVITGDVVVVDVDHTVQVRSLQSGALLWSSPDLGSFIYASPAVVQSGIYTVTHGSSSTGGVVAAYGYNKSSSTAIKRSLHFAKRPILSDWRPWSGR